MGQKSFWLSSIVIGVLLLSAGDSARAAGKSKLCFFPDFLRTVFKKTGASEKRMAEDYLIQPLKNIEYQDFEVSLMGGLEGMKKLEDTEKRAFKEWYLRNPYSEADFIQLQKPYFKREFLAAQSAKKPSYRTIKEAIEKKWASFEEAGEKPISQIAVNIKKIRVPEGKKIVYNEAVNQPLTRFSYGEIVPEFGRNFKRLEDIRFPFKEKNDFLTWYKTHAFTEAEFEKMQVRGLTMGEAFNTKVVEYVEEKNGRILTAPIRKIKKILSKAEKSCAGDSECAIQAKKTFVDGFKKTFPCMGRDENTLRSILIGFGVSNLGMEVGYGIAKHNQSKNGVPPDESETDSPNDKYRFDGLEEGQGKVLFPYDNMIFGALGTLPFGEESCRKKARLRADQIGRPLTGKPFISKLVTSSFKAMHREFVPYVGWSVITEPIYMYIHNKTKERRGHPVHQSLTSKEELLGMYVGWDTNFGAPRTIFLTDPLYNTTLPEQVKPLFSGSTTVGNAAAQAGYVVLDAGIRVGIGAINQYYFKKYEAWGSTKIISNNCKNLRSQFESCSQQCVASGQGLTIQSPRLTVPTCEACIPQITAFEDECVRKVKKK